MLPMDKLGVSAPYYKSYVIRNNKRVTIEQRVRALQATEYNMFSFPADLLCLDFLSDSGTTSMTDRQWAAMFLGDEAYGRNRGYYLLLEAFRDIFERGDSPKNAINMILTGEEDIDVLLDQLYLCNYEGGFVNGGIFHKIDNYLEQDKKDISYGLIAGIEYKLNPRLKCKVSGRYEKYKFLPEDINRKTYGAYGEIYYMLTKNANMSVSYNYTRGVSRIDTDDYWDNIIAVQVNVTF